MKANSLPCLAAAAIAIALGARPAAAAPPSPNEIVYQIFVRSFFDSNGDRIGDLRGIQEKLPYLKRLGVTSLLLTPVQPSPLYHNYFPDSFQGIDPAYGTMDDFRALVRAAHSLKLRLYLDVEFQYVTEHNPWYHSDYILYRGPNHTLPEPGFMGMSVLHGYDGTSVRIATVNLRDPRVLAFFENYFTDWLDPHRDGSLREGVDGFRIDHMMDDLDQKPTLTDLFATFWRPIFRRIREVNPAATLIAEQADWGYGRDWLTRGGVDLVFAFPLQRAMSSLDKAAIVQAIHGTESATPAGKGQLIFIENHDVARFATDVGQSLAKEKIGAALDLILRGTPLIYYGQEIGMRGKPAYYGLTDANDIPDREAMRWRRDLMAPGSAIWYRGPHPWWTNRYNRSDDGVSVEEESPDSQSLLNFYRMLIALRARHPEIEEGTQTIVGEEMPAVLAVLRRLGRFRSLLVVNLSGQPVRLNFSSDRVPGAGLNGQWHDLLDHDRLSGLSGTALAPYAVRLFGS